MVDCTGAGHFLPEEDDKFLERVRAAVEEEERQAAAAADTDAAKDAIATAESKKTVQSSGADARDANIKKDEATVNQDCITDTEKESSSSAAAYHEGHGSGGGYDTLANLPVEFYHYYHGSNTDMGTLIEVILANPFLGINSEAIQLVLPPATRIQIVLVIHFNNTGFNSCLDICSLRSFM